MRLDKLARFEKEFSTPIGVKYTALKQGLNNYYSTTHYLEGGLGLAYFSLPGEEETEFDNNNYLLEGYHTCFINSIIGFHHFIELHIKDILIEHHPSFGIHPKKFPGAKKFIEEIDSTIIFSEKSVNFLFAIEIIEELKKNQSNADSKHKLHPKYNFVATDENLSTIKKLYSYRNSTLHKADIILPAIPYDYFITQHVLPIINQFIQIEPDFILDEINKPIHCGVNVFNEILKIKINIDDLKKDDHNKELDHNLSYLAHLKELGRASYNRPIDNTLKELKQLEKENSKDDQDIFSYNYSKEIKKIIVAENYVKDLSLKENEKIWAIHNCPCCGVKTFLVFWRVVQPIEGMPRAYRVTEEAKCQFCDYEIDRAMGEPKRFKILKKDIFDNEDDIGWPFRSFNPTQKELDSYQELVRSIMTHGKNFKA